MEAARHAVTGDYSFPWSGSQNRIVASMARWRDRPALSHHGRGPVHRLAAGTLRVISAASLPSCRPQRRLVPAARFDELLGRAAAVGVSVDHDAAQVPDSRGWRCDPFGPLPFLAAQAGFGG